MFGLSLLPIMQQQKILAGLLASVILFGVTFLTPVAPQAATASNSPAIDFSFAGYEGSMPIRSVPAVASVRSSGRDDTALLQAAIDQVASLPAADGFRGALQLSNERFHVAGQLHLRASGVVLRGSVNASEMTTI